MGATYPIIAAYVAGQPVLGRSDVTRNAVPPPDGAEQDGVMSEWFTTSARGEHCPASRCRAFAAGTASRNRWMNLGTSSARSAMASNQVLALCLDLADEGPGGRLTGLRAPVRRIGILDAR
jgi:hypothetical protein